MCNEIGLHTLKWNGCFDSIFISSEGGLYGISSGMYSWTSIRSLNTLRLGRCMLPMTLWRNSAPDGAWVAPVLSPTADECSGNSCTIVNANKTAVRTAFLLLVTRKTLLVKQLWLAESLKNDSLVRRHLSCRGQKLSSTQLW